jgi:V-type H+-transporting ATPase subunit E
VIDDAIEEFKGILRAELNGLEFDVTIEVDEDKCLDERILKDNSIRTV